MNGFVKTLVKDRNFGFIRTDNGQEFFFHRESCLCDWDTLVYDFNTMGSNKVEVSFDKEKSPKGPRAANVERA